MLGCNEYSDFNKKVSKKEKAALTFLRKEMVTCLLKDQILTDLHREEEFALKTLNTFYVSCLWQYQMGEVGQYLLRDVSPPDTRVPYFVLILGKQNY